MPLIYQQNINAFTKTGVWEIKEAEDFFLKKVSLQREISHPHKRLQHLAGRYLLKELFPDFPNELIRIADTQKPYLEDEAYHFSISHCGNYAATVVSKECRVGVDIEMLNGKAEKVQHKFLSKAEQEMIGKFHSSHPYTAGWSIKEALFKWNGAAAIDFIEHLHIQNIRKEEQQLYKVDCMINKKSPVYLEVAVDFLGEFVLASCVQ